jgi:hypothetical protein
MRRKSIVLVSLAVACSWGRTDAQLWWERGADRWYYKDDEYYPSCQATYER